MNLKASRFIPQMRDKTRILTGQALCPDKLGINLWISKKWAKITHHDPPQAAFLLLK